MKESAESVRVVIFGDEYSIRSDVDAKTIQNVAEYVHKKMLDIHDTIPTKDTLKTAILSAMNIAGELFDYKDRYEKAEKTLETFQNRIHELNNKVEGVLGTHS
jgi:cell division protein ZapA